MDPTEKFGFYLGQVTVRWESTCVFIQCTVQPGGMSETVPAFYSRWLPPVKKENGKKKPHYFLSRPLGRKKYLCDISADLYQTHPNHSRPPTILLIL